MNGSKLKGGTRAAGPPTIFPGVPNSCLKQTNCPSRPTKNASSSAREENQRKNEEKKDKIGTFEVFKKEAGKMFKYFNVFHEGDDLTLSLTDKMGRKVKQFLHFKQVKSYFGFLFLERVEKDGIEIPQRNSISKKNSLIIKWSQIHEIILVTNSYEPTNEDNLRRALKCLESMADLHDSPHFQFIQAQLQLLLTPPKGRRFTKHILIFAAEIFCISPYAYSAIRDSGAICLPNDKLIRNLLSKASDDDNLDLLFKELKPEQRLVNVLFDEVKLTTSLRFTGGHIVGHATNKPGVVDTIATSALVIEIICHHAGPRYVFRVHPVAKLNAEELQNMLLEAVSVIKSKGGDIVSLVCDNCATNQKVYKLMSGPGKVTIEYKGEVYSLFLVFDYVHVYKNIRNNWITEITQQLCFTKDSKEYLACWSDVVTLYEEDRKSGSQN